MSNNVKMLKENKVVIVHVDLMPQYLSQGFDQVDEETGDVITPATGGRTLTLSEHNAKVAEVVAELKEEIKVLEVENDRLDKLVKSLRK